MTEARSTSAWHIGHLRSDSATVWLNIFATRRDEYAVQEADGSWRRAGQSLSEQAAWRHLVGEVTVGTYVLDGNLCRYGVCDADYGWLTDLQRMAFFLQSFDFHATLELSQPGRGHLWVMFEEPVEASSVRRLLQGTCRHLGIPTRTPDQPGMEVFPKQDRTSGYGSLIRGPLGIHRRTGQRYPVADNVTLQAMEPIACVEGQLILWDASQKDTNEALTVALREIAPRTALSVARPHRAAAQVGKLDILYWASQLTRLSPSGKSHKGLCPFHQEEHPSFHVYPLAEPKPSFHCFGCGVHGDAADLAAKVTGSPLADILRELRSNG